MKISTVAVAAAVMLWISVMAPQATSQEAFPDEPGRDAMMLACTQCHSLGKMVIADLDRDDWEFVVYDMVGRGAPVHEEDLEDIIEYLQNNFATDK